MTRDADLVGRLQQFGLSETEASVYLAVVRRGEATPSVVASDTGVSASYVYQLADRLADAGFVSVDDHRSPTRVRAHPPAESLRDRLETMQQTMSEVTERYERPPEDHDALEIVQSRQTLRKRIRAHAERAESELFLAVPVELLSDLAGPLSDAVERGVFVLLAAAGDLEAVDEDVSSLATAVRSWVRGTTVYVCADQTRGVISPSSLLGWEHGDAEAIGFVNRSVAVAVEAAFLGTVWPASEEAALREPSSLPTTYRGFRRAVYDATLRLRNGDDVAVEARVRPAGGGGRGRRSVADVRGRLVETRQSLVDPRNVEFGMENTLVVETDDGRVTVGGTGGFLEDYEAVSVTLARGER
ncbi:TrmB family transcriptional regulator [Halogeometricum sp. S1BR25-6]|uniref:TrmB family transcriptional regulator n=1 Tax=Halogeometricum salsisoli TaxID=2950536 RepID=A0ABU2GIR1_9EURY|nr:TrmB family transcriptional regulator sugar-binding domain-containing protein [Halogeometricum sp. S1BR25-6]MDS0300712.1 TrmB family transcriptional regulator [Halogeometricum sp. S1BR25-6]